MTFPVLVENEKNSTKCLSSIWVVIAREHALESALQRRYSQIHRDKCRPVILHGYGGAKKGDTSLAGLAQFGWIPMAAAMVGSASSPPLWTGQDWRPILGTSMDTRILPPSLSEKRKCTPAQSVDSPAPLMTCTSVLLTAGFRLPKSMSHLVLIVMLLRILFESCLWILGPPHTLIMLFGPQKADQAMSAKRPSMRSHRLRVRLRRRTKYFPHLKKFLWRYDCRWTVVVQPNCQPSLRFCLVELLSVAEIVSFGYKLSKITLM